MNTILIGYDLNKQGQRYAELIEKIKTFGAWWHHLDSTWLVKTTMTHVQVRDALKPFLDGNDELLVIDVTKSGAAWYGLSESASKWILDNL